MDNTISMNPTIQQPSHTSVAGKGDGTVHELPGYSLAFLEPGIDPDSIPLQSLAASVHDPEASGLFSPWSMLIATFRQTPDPSKTKTLQLSTLLKINEYRICRLFEDAKDLCNSPAAVSDYSYEVCGMFSPWSILMSSFKQNPHPPQSKISQLSAQLNIGERRIYRLLEDARDICRSSIAAPIGLISPETTRSVLPSSNSILESSLDTEYIPASPSNISSSKRKRRTKSSPNTTSGLTSNKLQKRSRRRFGADTERGKYPCLSCPPKSPKSKSMDEWYTHQERKHFPKQVFSCGISVDEKPCKYASRPIKRQDNFKNHLKTHGLTSVKELGDEVSKRTLKVEGLFHDKCGFCSHVLSSWGESMEHIGRHIEYGAQIDQWEHKCSSLEHEMLPNVHFALPSANHAADNKKPDDEDSDNDDKKSDDEDSDNDDLDGGNAPWEGHNSSSFESEDFFDPSGSNARGGNDFNGDGDYFSPTNYDGFFWNASYDHMQNSRLASPSIEVGQHRSPLGPLESVSMVRNLGAGAFGTVSEVTNTETWKTCAVKTFRRKRTGSDGRRDLEAFNDEVQIMKQLRALQNPHLVSYLGSFVHLDRFSIIMQPVADTDLAHYLRFASRKDKRLANSPIEDPSKVLLQGMASLASALRDIHSIQIWHQDIKPSNILIKNGDFLLADFGISKSLVSCKSSTNKGIQMTPQYAAPEAVKKGRLSSAVDIWSLGCVYAEMATWIAGRDLSDFKSFRTTRQASKDCHQTSTMPKGKFKQDNSICKDHFHQAEDPFLDESYWNTLEKTHEWIDMLNEEQKRTGSSDQAHSIPFDMIRKMLSENPEDRLTSQEVWLRFPKCACCADRDSTQVHTRLDQPDDENSLLVSHIDWGSIAGLFSLGILVSQSLVKFYASYTDLDSEFVAIMKRLEALSDTLQDLKKTISDRKSQADERNLIKNIETSIKGCDEFIRELQSEYEKFSKASSDGIKVAVEIAGCRSTYPFRQSTSQKLDEAINGIRANLSSALSVLQSKENHRIQDNTAEIKVPLDLVRTEQISPNLRNWLNAPDATVDYNAASLRKHPGTGMWLINSSSYTEWLTGSNSILSVSGVPGSGKLALASISIILDALDEVPAMKHEVTYLIQLERMRKWTLQDLHLFVTTQDEQNIHEVLDLSITQQIAVKNLEIDKDFADFVSDRSETNRKLQKWKKHRDKIWETLARCSKLLYVDNDHEAAAVSREFC